MGYAPRYGYTALKNNNQDESHKGFKDTVLNVGKYWVYFRLHAHISQPRRFETRFHTLVLAVKEKASGDLKVELSFKADYGALTVRKNGGGIQGVNEKEEILREELNDLKLRIHRLINVIDQFNLDPRWSYREGESLMHGRYEQWATRPMCSSTVRGGEPTVDIRNPTTALKDADGKLSDVTYLGRKSSGVFNIQPSLNRRFRVKECVLSSELCGFDIPKSGKFYTDVYGKELRDGPGLDAIAQYFEPGFKFKISGGFETDQTWLGTYRDGKKGRFQDIGYGIVEKMN